MNNKTFNDRPKWFNEKCYNAKKDFTNARNIFARHKTLENRTTFVNMRTKYNRIRQRAKYDYKRMEGKQLEGIAKSQPKKFWKTLNKCNTKSNNTKNNINIENLHSHFNDLLGQIPDNDHTNDHNLHNQINNDLDSAITEQEIRKAVFKQKQRTNGPVNAHLRSAAYTNKHV